MQRVQLGEAHNVLGSLRAMFPERQLRWQEAMRVAELQAGRLLQLTGIETAAVPNEVVSELPRIRVTSGELPTSGMSFWDGNAWVICLNRTEPVTRQRFTLFHEFKHIIDHGSTGRLYTGGRLSAERQAEAAADYFAGCVLMPRMLLKQAWATGIQHPAAVAQHFETSVRAAEVRLAQVGLVEDRERHPQINPSGTAPRLRGSTYYRTVSLNWPLNYREELAI